MNAHVPPPARQPVFNLPGVVVGLIAVLVAIHAARAWLLTPTQDENLLLAFAFLPTRIGGADIGLPGGVAGDIWTFVTYAFLHGGWEHLIVNSVWMAAFGAPLARRFGVWRFLAFSLIGAVGGALAHLVAYWQELVPMVGASAAISAYMAAACRFMLVSGGPLGLAGTAAEAYRRPAVPLLVALRDPRVLSFLGVWLVVNVVTGLVSGSSELMPGAIAWQAHIGGFIAGLIAFPLLDPIGSRRDTAPAV